MSIKKISHKILRNQKPIEYDIHLRYVCSQCGQTHWLSINEASTQRFKIVCFCGHVFGVKRVKNFKLLFHKKPKPSEQSETKLKTEIKSQPPKELPIIPIELLDKTVPILVGYGFTKLEARKTIAKSYGISPVDNPTGLVKQILESLRNTNVK